MDIPTIIAAARELEISELVLTDINNSTGCTEFIRECYKQSLYKESDETQKGNKPYHLKPVTGIEF